MKRKKIIGILGGMGPSASGYLYNTINSLAVREYGAKKNQDFPETILYSVPVPDFISSNKNRKRAFHMLEERVEEMNNFPISIMGIACNTAHILLPDLEKKSQAKFISMINETTREVLEKNIKKIGLLATSSTVKSELYQKSLKGKGVQIILPSKKDQIVVDAIIKDIVREKRGYMQKEKLVHIVRRLAQSGAKAIVLGCTELPLVFPDIPTLPVFNSVEILAKSLLRETMV